MNFMICILFPFIDAILNFDAALCWINLALQWTKAYKISNEILDESWEVWKCDSIKILNPLWIGPAVVLFSFRGRVKYISMQIMSKTRTSGMVVSIDWHPWSDLGQGASAKEWGRICPLFTVPHRVSHKNLTSCCMKLLYRPFSSF